jgi:hypothetical protein
MCLLTPAAYHTDRTRQAAGYQPSRNEMGLSDLEKTPGNILAICLSTFSLLLVAVAVGSWIKSSDQFLPDAAAAAKGFLFSVVAWLARERVDQGVRAFDGSIGWHRVLPLIEMLLIGSLVAIGGNVLVDHLIHP